jgi:hypothetical protein
MINKRDLNKPIKDYGFDEKTISIDIAQQDKIGEGGEGATFKVQLTTNDNTINKNVVCKEINYI